MLCNGSQKYWRKKQLGADDEALVQTEEAARVPKAEGHPHQQTNQKVDEDVLQGREEGLMTVEVQIAQGQEGDRTFDLMT